MEDYKRKGYKSKEEKGKGLLYSLLQVYVVSNPKSIVGEDGLSKSDLETILKLVEKDTDIKE